MRGRCARRGRSAASRVVEGGLARVVRIFGVEKAALTGLVERGPVPGDRRALRVTLTGAGRRSAAFHAEVTAEQGERLPLEPRGPGRVRDRGDARAPPDSRTAGDAAAPECDLRPSPEPATTDRSLTSGSSQALSLLLTRARPKPATRCPRCSSVGLPRHGSPADFPRSANPASSPRIGCSPPASIVTTNNSPDRVSGMSTACGTASRPGCGAITARLLGVRAAARP